MSDSDLRWSLRQLPKEAAPGRDLWPDISARIAVHDGGPEKARPQWRRPSWAIAAGASLLALGLGWSLPQRVPNVQEQMLQRQVAAMVSEYDAAWAQVAQEDVPPTLHSGLHALDASIVQIRQALQHDPQSLWLIERLQRTYALRLQLVQRGMPS